MTASRRSRFIFRVSALLIAVAIGTVEMRSARASIVRELYRGSEPLAMGNAFVAIADDENAIFYNPAGVAGYDSMTLHLLKADVAVSGDTITAKDSIEALNNPSGAALNQLMGKNLYLQGTGASFLTVPNLGIAAFYDAQGALYPVNQTLPKLEFGYQRTSGVQLAFGFSSKGTMRKTGRGKRNPRDQNEWRVGAAMKYLQRQGGFKVIPVSQLVSYSSEEDFLSLVGRKGSGYGLDLGVQRVQKVNPRTTLYFGSAFTNIGDIQVGNGSDSVKAILAAGVGAGFDLTVGTLTLAYDMRHLTREDDWRKKQHMGARFAFPFLLDLYAGLNQTYLTYGVGVDLLMVRVNAVAYREESGSFVQQDPERRYQVTVDLKFPL